MSIQPETLFAFLDGSLGAAERERVRSELLADPRAAEALGRQVLLAEAARASFADDLREPVPASWVARVNEARARAGAPRARPDRRGWDLSMSPLARWLGGAAMAAALAAGVYLGPSRPAEGLIRADGSQLHAAGALAEALDAAPGGVLRPIGAGQGLQVQLSLRTAAGRYCREAILQTPGAGTDQHLLACKESSGWQVAALAPAAARVTGFAPVDGHRPLDAVVSGIEGEVLDGNGETRARAQGWLPAPGGR